MPTPMLTSALLLAAALVAFGLVTDRRAEFRAARIEATFPPEGIFVEVGGRQVHVVVRGNGPDLVLIHGAGGNARDFTWRLAARLETRYRVFAVDRPGLGWSERVDPASASPFAARAEGPVEQARHLAAAVRELGAERPVVVGHSFGGAVAMAWALEDDPAALVIVAGATMPWPGPLDPYYRIMGSLPGRTLLAPLAAAWMSETHIENAARGVFAPQPMPPHYVDGAGVPLATRAETLRASALQVRTLRPHLVAMSARYPEVSIPVEIIHGTADASVHHDVHAEPLSALLPDARLTLIDGVGHAPHHVAPEELEAAIDRAASRAGLR